MHAAWVCLAGLAVLALGYRFYSRYLAERVFALRDDEPVPAVTRADGVDFVATDRHVLLGHHYASIAGAAPIIGPAIAVVWGWLPAVVWVVFGTVLMGAVHDFATLVISIRHEGRSVGAISEVVLGRRSRTLFLLVIYFLVFLVIAVFADAIATLFQKQPATVIPINFEIIIALLIGWMAHKRGMKLLWPSLLALAALYGMVWVGVQVPVELPAIGPLSPKMLWIVLLLAYAFVASVLPVWVLLQPRDFINSHQLVVGLGALLLGIFIANPAITAPAINTAPADAPAWFPFLFVTIACGAISGFHGLVSSGTTSKQLARAGDARLVGYGGMLGEGTLALIATLAVSAGLADWAAHYGTFAHASAGGVVNFVTGASSFLAALGLPGDISATVVAVLVVSFAATTLDTGTRIQRYILHELGEIYGVRALGNRWLAGALAVALPLAVCIAGQQRALWPLFGGSNQMLAGLSLMLISVWLYRQGRAWWVTAVPMLVVLTVSFLALLTLVGRFFGEGEWLLAVVGTLMLALEVWVVGEGLLALRRGQPGGGSTGPSSSQLQGE